MNSAYKMILAMVIMLTLASCDKSKDEPVVVPSNLTFTTEIATDGSGLVSVQATADNANYFTIYFGDNTTDPPVIANDGKATHTYTTSGTYTITVLANQAVSAYITRTQNITVDVNSSVPIPTEGYSTPESYEGMTLVWQDEFNGTSVDETSWTFETGNNGGWGNHELEFYKKENATIQDGNLLITAKKEGTSYTSTRMITKGKKEFQYGRIDIRAVLPKGQGIWPALWMLGANITDVGWPKSGEIDIMEMIGGQGREKTVYGTLHWDNAGSHACTCDKPGYSLSSGIFADKFHVFSLEWDQQFITWYVDDVQFNKIDITPAELSEFHAKYFFIFNLAVGGDWPGNPNTTTTFPQYLIVDYIRVFQ
jgi:beta-glucanase (GH16 family)